MRTPIGLQAVALLAVQNNPDLRAARARAGVAQAQLLQAGILPNPAVSAAVLPLVAGVPIGPGLGSTLAWNAGISEDVAALVTLHARKQAATADAGQVNAEILWQEWQLVGKTWLLCVQVVEGQRALRLLDDAVALYGRLVAASGAAMRRGNATLASVAPDRAALQAAQAQRFDLERLQQQHRHALASLLGLQPDAAIPLDGSMELPPLDAATILAMLPDLARRRPDLVALQLGYRGQNARLRAAILSRFPNLLLGVTGGSDNADVRNVGPQLSLDLPIFNHGQGNIAIATATREQLRAEYAARLAAAVGQVRAMLSEEPVLRLRIGVLRQGLVAARRDAASARTALARGDLDERSAVDLIASELDMEVELVMIEQSLLEQRVAIDALVGLGMRPVALPGANG